MIVDPQKVRELLGRPTGPADTTELRREGNIFFVGGELPARETLETLFESHCQTPADFFHLRFGPLDAFPRGEELARLIKKNFNAHLMGRLDYPAPVSILERAYAAGIDIVDIPLAVFDEALSRDRGLAREERVAALARARTIFPRWSVTSTLMAGEEPSCATIAGIDFLLGQGIVPLLEVSPRADHCPVEEVDAVFTHLAKEWRRYRVVITHLIPLLHATTPLVPEKPKGRVREFIERVYDRQLLATSDLRRSLRVRQVEESFESAGL